MYFDFFHFARPPFVNTADPAFFYPSAAHQEALSTLLYGIKERKGLCVLTGPVGSGKTMILRTLTHEHAEFCTLLLANPWVNEQEFFLWLLGEWGGGSEKTQGELLGQLKTTLLKRVQEEEMVRFVLLADEAQLLSETMLEAVRLLLNLEEERGKLIQIVLSGQEELAAILRQYHLRPLLQRVALVEHLRSFDLDDTIGYIQHRLRVAGGDPYLFPRPCVEWIHRESRGIPRLINQICDHALIFAFGRRSRTIERQDIEAALAKLPLGTAFLEPEPEPEPESQKEKVAEKLLHQQNAVAASKEIAVPSETPAAETISPQGVERPPEPPTTAATESVSEIPGLAGGRAASRGETSPLTATADAISPVSFPPASFDKERKGGQGWLVHLMIVVAALLLGAGVAYLWMTQRIATEDRASQAPSSQEKAASPSQAVPFASTEKQPLPFAPSAASRSSADTPSAPSAAGGGAGQTPASLPLPVASRFSEITVSDAKALLSMLSKHFGADNSTVRDLFAAMNPTIDLNRIMPNTRVRLPQLRRDEMIVADMNGRFFIYYATLADEQQAADVKQRLAPLGVAVVQIPATSREESVLRLSVGPLEETGEDKQASLAGQAQVRLYFGPFNDVEAAKRVVDLLRFTFLPMLERGESASGS